MSELKIEYRFRLLDGQRLGYELRLDERTLLLKDFFPGEPPEWARLGFHKCPNCTLPDETHAHCPAAVNLAALIQELGALQSFDEIELEVATPQRTVSGRTTAQKGVSSLLGLVMAASACPHTGFFRPMARFHLPLATEEETVYRAASMYLLAQYFRHKAGAQVDFDLDGLAHIYKNLQVVNARIAERLRAASEKDAAVNAVVLLDLLAKAMPYSIEESLEEIAHLFTGYLEAPGGDDHTCR